MPKLTPVDHNPFADDIANAMGQGQEAPAGPADVQAAGLFKWMIQQGHDPLADADEGLFGAGTRAPRDNMQMGQDLRRDLTSSPQSIDPAALGAMLAPDGNHYISDPGRAGKYLLLRH